MAEWLIVLSAFCLAIAAVSFFLATRQNLWTHYEHHPPLAELPATAYNRKGVPADPMNVAFAGTRRDVVEAMGAAGWQPADPITPVTSMKIAVSAVAGIRYSRAPVSPMYAFGRRQDLAFEQAVEGAGCRQRHHVRLWISPKKWKDGRPIWLGAATFDQGLGFVAHTMRPTHRIEPDVDSERDKLEGDLERAHRLGRVFQVTGVGPTVSGRTANGDAYFTDGELTVGILRRARGPRVSMTEHSWSPLGVSVKNLVWWALWSFVRPLLAARRRFKGG